VLSIYDTLKLELLMAKNYIDNLSEEARKGQQEKAEQGIWPYAGSILIFLHASRPEQ